MNWKDNETWSIWIDTVNNIVVKHVIEYDKYYERYKLTVYIDWELYNQLTEFDSIQDAKYFSYAYNEWLSAAFVYAKIKLSFLFN